MCKEEALKKVFNLSPRCSKTSENTRPGSSLSKETLHTSKAHPHGGSEKEQTMLCPKCFYICLAEDYLQTEVQTVILRSFVKCLRQRCLDKA